MEIIEDLKEIPDLSLALGTFDGIHLGHKAVITSAVNFAQERNLKSAVLSFKVHPYAYLSNREPEYISVQKQRYKYIEELGVDYLIEMDFSKIANFSVDDYVQNILLKYFSPKAISTGFNHKFGKGRAGDVKYLIDNQDKYNYEYLTTLPIQIYGETISSTRIKNYLRTGNINMANMMLDREFSIIGTVVEGKKLGKTLGFPTANIIYPKNVVQIPYGVYQTKVKTSDGKMYPALTNYGTSPTVSSSDEAYLEAHILDFSKELYGQEIEIFFLEKVRSEIKFNNVADLIEQMNIDLKRFSQIVI